LRPRALNPAAVPSTSLAEYGVYIGLEGDLNAVRRFTVKGIVSNKKLSGWNKSNRTVSIVVPKV